MKKSKTLLALILLMAFMLLSVGIMAGCNDDDDSETQAKRVETDIITGFVPYVYTIGLYDLNSADKVNMAAIDAKALLGYSDSDSVTFELSNNYDYITLADGKLTATSAGNFNLKAKLNGETSTYDCQIIDAVNVFDFNDLYYAVAQSYIPVIQAEIDFADITSSEFKNNISIAPESSSLLLKTDLYGNGHQICIEDITGTEDDYFTTAFKVSASGITVKDLHMSGKNIQDSIQLNELERHGIMFDLDGDETDTSIGANFINCFFENGNRLITINNADVTLKGCILRNAGDSCVSIQTNNDGPSIVNMENNAMGNATVACVCLWGYTEMTTESYVTLNITGFFDAYNWKARSAVALMPDHELANLPVKIDANGVIRQEINKASYESELYAYNNDFYVNCAIIVIATGSCKENKATLNIADSVQMTYKELPIPGYIEKLIMHTCKIAGYTNNNEIYLQPDYKIGGDPNLMNDLRYGRD